MEKTDYEALRKIPLYDTAGKTRGDLCMPSLEEYLRICKTYDKIAVLELKNPYLKEEIAEILEIVRNTYQIEKLIFISFVFENLVYLRELEPKAEIQSLCMELSDEFMERLLKYRIDVDIYFKNLSEEDIEALHEKGIKVNCWTVDSPSDAERLIAAGVDFITTDILE